MEASIFRLPPELRNEIWDSTFRTAGDYAVTLQTNKIWHPLTLVCRQIRLETLSMYLGTTPFNAHLDDMPAMPLAHWLRTIGAEKCLSLREVNIWDIHMLNGTLFGVEMTRKLLKKGTESGESFMLQSVGREVFHRNWFMKDIILPLQSIGVGIERFCIVQDDGSLKQTSYFAMVPISEPGGIESIWSRAEEFGLNERTPNKD